MTKLGNPLKEKFDRETLKLSAWDHCLNQSTLHPSYCGNLLVDLDNVVDFFKLSRTLEPTTSTEIRRSLRCPN